MFKLKKVVDERQELELLKIEKMGFWVIYWLLLISLIVQSLFMGKSFAYFGGEFVVFMLASLYVSIACFRKGQWDYYSTPSLKSYLIYSLGGSVIFSAIVGVSKFMNYESVRHNPWGLGLPIIGILFVFMFFLIFITLAGFGHVVKKRQLILEKAYDEEDEIE